MLIDYTGRQTDITLKHKLQAESGLARVAIILGNRKSTAAHVILSVDKYRHIAEVTVTGGTKPRGSKGVGSKSIVARCESVEMQIALHNALEKIEQQAIRRRQKTTTFMRHPRVLLAKTAAAEADA